jgi:hypothetical protein
MPRRKGNAPAYIVRAAHGNDKRFTTRIGACWPFNDGDGYVMELDFIPLKSTTLILVRPQGDEEKEERRNGAQEDRDGPIPF